MSMLLISVKGFEVGSQRKSIQSLADAACLGKSFKMLLMTPHHVYLSIGMDSLFAKLDQLVLFLIYAPSLSGDSSPRKGSEGLGLT